MSELKYRRIKAPRQAGTALLMTVFVIALLSAIVMGILQVNTVDVQIMQNHLYPIEARMVAQAGLNDAVSQLRLDSDWDEGFENKVFNGGTYSVTVKKDMIEATGISARGFTCVVSAEFTAISSTPPHAISLGALRINR